jgi:hypothetical protein
LYGFGDALRKGFGSTMLSKRGIKYQIGLWGPTAEDESSNWKEFENRVEALEHEADEGNLNNAMVYFFTDNSMVESCIYRGNSSSMKLFFQADGLNAETRKLRKMDPLPRDPQDDLLLDCIR